jgi:ubiquinone/menaquinone biosynthesis C-methylase UbiE
VNGSRRAAPLYVCGHTARELDRLGAQSSVFHAITRDVFVEAGIEPGMRVLDIGCGAGDVSVLVHDLVGDSGFVLGIDRSAEAITAARDRATEQGLDRVDFVMGDIESADDGVLRAGGADGMFDAVVGRFVLMHQRDPAETLRAAAVRVRAGGIVAMIESHMELSVAPVHSFPHSPTYDRMLRWMTATIRAAGGHAGMGLRLRTAFLHAGLPEPVLRLHAKAEGGANSTIYRYTAESLRSMLPLARHFGIVDLTDADVDALEDQLRTETLASDGVLVSPVIVGASSSIAHADR